MFQRVVILIKLIHSFFLPWKQAPAMEAIVKCIMLPCPEFERCPEKDHSKSQKSTGAPEAQDSPCISSARTSALLLRITREIRNIPSIPICIELFRVIGIMNIAVRLSPNRMIPL